MHAAKKITYHDLREEALRDRLPPLVGRIEEMERLSRIVGRRVNNNVAVVGPSGSGKTALVHGWMRRMSRRAPGDAYALLQLDAGHLHNLDDDALEEHYAEALKHVPSCALFIDDLGRSLYKQAPLAQRFHRLYKQLLARPDVHVVASLEPQERAWLEREYPALLHAFEIVALKDQADAQYARVLSRKVPRLNARHRVVVPDDALGEIVALSRRFPVLGQLPRSAMRLLDESIALCAAEGQKVLTREAIARVASAKTGVPRARLTQGELRSIGHLEDELNRRIVGQKPAMAKIARALQRAKLGLRAPERPLCSFLLLGPSGVGKTETAKCVAELMFERTESFIRLDMSEFQQDHTVQRLIGAPPGYVGYEEGGALTNALRAEPYSLILLDEIEKAHPKVFDVFLQLLDDGRLTSGQSETVDARNAIVMATSNAGVQEILKAHAEGVDIAGEAFTRERILPVLARTFRPEFLNRFDAILTFKPLTVTGLVEIARLEVKKIEKRLAKHRVRFEIEPTSLEERIRRMADPRFGARPMKRFLEEACESLLAQSLLEANA